MESNMENNPNKIVSFTFGDPEPVLDGRGIFDYLQALKSSKWYEPPVSLDGLAKTFGSAVHHASAIIVKRNILSSMYVGNKKFSKADFSKIALDFLVFGNSYIHEKRNRLGGVLGYESLMSKYMRRDINLVNYWWVPSYNEEVEIKGKSSFHLIEPDINQEIYGVPQYLPALNSALLNESATLFRRKYYANGSHAGFILYINDPGTDQDDIKNIRQALKDSKGPGNFRNLFLYSPNGKKDGIQLIPVSQVAASDEFLNIKNVTRDDLLAIHRVPPQLMGIVPNNTGGFGDADKSAKIFIANEIDPLIEQFKQINDWAGESLITFKPYALDQAA
jgi:PBSX family phage portal protein